MLGIIGAMDEEVDALKKQMQDVSIMSKAGMEFYQGLLCQKPVVVVRSGVGKVNAAICCQILADTFEVTAVINTGIAGSLRSEINIGDIVLSTDALQHDMDAVAFGYEAGQIPRMDTLAFQADEKLSQLAEDCCHSVIPEVKVFHGRVVSGDQFVAKNEVKERIRTMFGGYCTEMEGAAIAQAAYLNKIPFLIIRAISDKADDSAHMDYPSFEKLAIARSVKLMTEIAARY